MLDAARGWLRRAGDSRARLRESGQTVPKKHEIDVLREAATAVSEYVIKKAELSAGRRQETPRVSRRGRSKDLFHD